MNNAVRSIWSRIEIGDHDTTVKISPAGRDGFGWEMIMANCVPARFCSAFDLPPFAVSWGGMNWRLAPGPDGIDQCEAKILCRVCSFERFIAAIQNDT